jgi:DNA-binding TFAR19-related protein (PDSD5 family)
VFAIVLAVYLIKGRIFMLLNPRMPGQELEQGQGQETPQRQRRMMSFVVLTREALDMLPTFRYVKPTSAAKLADQTTTKVGVRCG